MRSIGVYVAVKFGGNDTILNLFLTKFNSDWNSVLISIKHDNNTIVNYSFAVVFGVRIIMSFLGGNVVLISRIIFLIYLPPLECSSSWIFLPQDSIS